MSKLVSEWTEDDVLSLPLGENDTFERKGARLLDLTLSDVDENDVRNELAKQLSAFANTGGGQIIYGVKNNGTVDDGGVHRTVRGSQTTKEWLENLIPGLTDFEILGFNVYEIFPKPTGSLLAPDKSLYVVDVPDSERAPHQSRRDLKYYVRMGGKSQPASHRIIEDIHNRAKHPRLSIRSLKIYNAQSGPSTSSGLKSRFTLSLSVKCDVLNSGKVRASTSCLQVSGMFPISTTNIVTGDYVPRTATPGTILLELRHPLYPQMQFPLSFPIDAIAEVEVLSYGEALSLSGIYADDVRLFITTFADNAPPEKHEFKLNDIDPERLLRRVIEQEARRSK